MNELSTIQSDVLQLPTDCSNDSFLDLHARLRFVLDAGKDLLKQLEARMVERIEQTGKPIPIGDGREFRLVKKTEKWVEDNTAAIEAILQLGGGDVKAITDCLGSGAIKHGALASFFELADRKDLVAKHIKSEVKTEIVAGVVKPVKKLELVDPKFAVARGGRR